MKSNIKLKISVCLLIILTSFAFGQVALPELTRPAILIVRGGNMFILEGTTVYIYNAKNFKLLKTFGRAGEGPGEFKINPNEGRPMSMSLYKNQILVNSIAKMSYFDLKGNFVEEKRVANDALLFPIKKQFVAIGPVMDPKTQGQFLGFKLLAENLTDSKILYLSEFNLGNSIRELLLPVINFTYNPVYKDKIYLSSSTSEFLINVFDSTGKKLYSIKKDYKNIPTPKDYKKTCLNWFKTHPQFKRQYEMIKNIVKVREFFPTIRDLQLVDDVLHVLTYQRKGELWECIMMDLKGKELGRKFIPLQKFEPFSFYPILYSSYQGKMYTLVENEEEENWEIHITPLK